MALHALLNMSYYILNKYRNRLHESTEKCVRVMSRDLFGIDNFPWDQAMSK